MQFIFLFLTLFECFALRVPASFDNGRIISNGFEIDYHDSSWTRANTPESLENKILALFRLKKNDEATLTVRTDTETGSQSLREYTQKWVKNYSQYGMKVLGFQNFKNKFDVSGFVVDIQSQSKEKKIRQVIYFKNSNAVIFTCIDNNKAFNETLKKCNELMQAFSWKEGSATEKLSF